MPLTADLVSRIIVSDAYLKYNLTSETQSLCVDAIWDWGEYCIPFWVTLTLASDLACRIIVSEAYLLYYFG